MVKEKLYIVYSAVSAISAFFFVITFNDLIIQNSVLISDFNLNKEGNWQYWILIASIILFIYFIYMATSTLSDIFKFNNIIKIESKKTFLKNIPFLEKVAKRMGKKYGEKLVDAKLKRGIKK